MKRTRWILLFVASAAPAAVLFVNLKQHISLRDNFQVSQRGREFRPGTLDVRQGDVVHINNDDEDLSHHAYVAAERFKFDSEDQEPGRSVDITFTVPGTFNVLCGIHPKMRLTVNVQ